jgi:hypothetical protein
VKINKLLEVLHSIKFMNDIFDEDEPDMSEAIALNQQRIETFKMRQAELLSRAD